MVGTNIYFATIGNTCEAITCHEVTAARAGRPSGRTIFQPVIAARRFSISTGPVGQRSNSTHPAHRGSLNVHRCCP